MADAGWPVFPLVPRSKKPFAGSHGHLDATTDPAQVSRWAVLNPDANVGLRPPAGVVVVDVDDPREFASWVAEHGLPLPRTREVATRRGRHLYYRLPPTTRPLRNELPGVRVDLKTERGFVLAPGSVHDSGKVYRLTREVPLAALPELPREWLPLVQRSERRPRPVAGQGELPATASAGDVHRLARTLALKRPGTGRRGTARWAFCQAWRNFAHDPPALAQALRSLERAALDVGLDPRDVEGLLAYAEAEHTTTTEEPK